MELVKVENGIIKVAEEYLNGYAEYLKQKAIWELKEKEFRKELEEAMEKNDIKSFENDLLKVTYVPSFTRTKFNTKNFEETHPRLYRKYLTTSSVSSSIKVTVKELK